MAARLHSSCGVGSREMPKEIRINAFSMNCLGHLSPGLWTHPNDNSVRYNTLGYWTDLAKLLEAGLIDSLFLADVLGLYDVFRGGPETAIQYGTQTPNNDPLLVIPAMAAVTQNLGFAATAALSFEPPYTFARRMSTLDHLTGGRIGWNIVTGYLDSAARGAGREKQTSHDARYEIAHDYMDVVYKLWEGSWDDDAVVRNRATGAYADPRKVRRVRHRGPHYQIDAVHLSEPSPQRTPLLFQAGTSLKGREFAARHAECVFLNGRSKPIVAARVADIRNRAVRTGAIPPMCAPSSSSAWSSTERSRRRGPNSRTTAGAPVSKARLPCCRDGWGSISPPTDSTSR